ncbi:MAG: M23 family metallopeptidase, partial [Acidimicrobiia bacterium]|nr:M23 family metallopeptidase [Acidimicrobiia bacterium]
MADGIVVSTLDELEPNAPGLLPANDPVLAAQLTFDTVDGNHIVPRLAPHVYAFYAHLQKGTIAVEEGDRVRKGQVIARLGNTGNANVSHLHFHLMDGASILGSNAVPYLIDRFAYDGQVSRQAIVDTDDYLSGTFDQGRLPRPEPRTREYPLARSQSSTFPNSG